MTDDLVKRLRQGDHFEKVMSAAQAADRIEELEAKLATCKKYRDAYAEMGRIGTEAYRDLEALLVKAEHIVCILASAEWDDRLGEAVDLACAYLAEVEEG